MLLSPIIMLPPRTLLVATDFSPASEAAVRDAARLAKDREANLVLLHAYEFATPTAAQDARIPPPLLDGGLAEAHQQNLERLADPLRRDGLVVHTVARRGGAPHAITALADELDADLVVVGTHGRRGVSRWLLGSVAERVLRICERPLLIVHADAAA